MSSKYREYKGINFPELEKEILEKWKAEATFEKSISLREGSPSFTFYEGPPSANGMPGIHHVISRTIKDTFCRYKTLQGFQVNRKGGWDTHGLPVELQVEKALGITKEDIGKKISVEEYNEACRKDVLKFKDSWDQITERIGFWVDLNNPYITYENNYIESCWWLLKQMHERGFLYEGYTVQPYSPAAGTGLSSHELNQPGTYKMLKDTSIVAQFEIRKDQNHNLLNRIFENTEERTCFLAWTTTPWTLPSNCALAVGENITYVKIKTLNPYTFNQVSVILAKDLINKYFKEEGLNASIEGFDKSSKTLPWSIVDEFSGKELIGLKYHQLMPYVVNDNLLENAFRVISGDFVTTEDGTGIVHTASIFGADDFRAAKAAGVPSVLVKDEKGNEVPLVDKQGRFVKEVSDFALRYVKEEYYSDEERKSPDFKPTDVLIAIKLKEDDKAFKVEKYEHSYPHCWRTDKPILYYPLESWFIKTTAVKQRLVELNKTINWKPESTGTGRFGNWLENLVDWNLSRSRYWGTPLPIWRSEEGDEEICIGSVEELKSEIAKSVKAGFMQDMEITDLHKPQVDQIILVSPQGKKMNRVPDLIDVWFDSGAMPYAQWHFPFENEETFKKNFPADFIAEGVDQTRGWFFTLHAISVMLFDSIAYKNVVANGLVLDKNGNKMSKRLGNAIDPFKTVNDFGADAVRWYMLSNSAPWDNLKFDLDGVAESQKKFFATLYNCYSFFALYANIDGFTYSENDIKQEERPEIDRWILSLLQSLIIKVEQSLNDYDPTPAARAIQEFANEHLSNWYVRLCRRRFWKGEYSTDKISAYQTLYTCLETLSKLMASFAPFYADRLFRDLNNVSNKEKADSVHLSNFPKPKQEWIDKDLEARMQIAQDLSSLVLSLRKKVNIKVRQPLAKMLVPVLDQNFAERLEKVKDLILSEVNVKELKYLTDDELKLVKKVKPNFKSLGPKVGNKMKTLAGRISALTQEQIREFEANEKIELDLEGELFVLEKIDVEILSDDIPGWQVATDGKLTVALDIHLDDALIFEGIAREMVNRVQNLRKDSGLEVTDKILIRVESKSELNKALETFKNYICAETLANDLELVDNLQGLTIEINEIALNIEIKKV